MKKKEEKILILRKIKIVINHLKTNVNKNQSCYNNNNNSNE